METPTKYFESGDTTKVPVGMTAVFNGWTPELKAAVNLTSNETFVSGMEDAQLGDAVLHEGKWCMVASISNEGDDPVYTNGPRILDIEKYVEALRAAGYTPTARQDNAASA
jgi:hypothetical protein